MVTKFKESELWEHMLWAVKATREEFSKMGPEEQKRVLTCLVIGDKWNLKKEYLEAMWWKREVLQNVAYLWMRNLGYEGKKEDVPAQFVKIQSLKCEASISELRADWLEFLESTIKSWSAEHKKNEKYRKKLLEGAKEVLCIYQQGTQEFRDAKTSCELIYRAVGGEHFTEIMPRARKAWFGSLEIGEPKMSVEAVFFVRYALENAPKFKDKSMGEARMEWLEFLVQWADEAEYVEIC